MMVKSKVRHQARATEMEICEKQYSSRITYLRIQLSVCCVCAVAECLHIRLLQVGQVSPGVTAAKRRREMAMVRDMQSMK